LSRFVLRNFAIRLTGAVAEVSAGFIAEEMLAEKIPA
jgi:hypothetical protein